MVGYCYKYTCATYGWFCGSGSHINIPYLQASWVLNAPFAKCSHILKIVTIPVFFFFFCSTDIMTNIERSVIYSLTVAPCRDVSIHFLNGPIRAFLPFNSHSCHNSQIFTSSRRFPLVSCCKDSMREQQGWIIGPMSTGPLNSGLHTYIEPNNSSNTLPGALPVCIAGKCLLCVSDTYGYIMYFQHCTRSP